MVIAADYDPLEHLNAIFSRPTTLSSISRTAETLQDYQDDLDEDIAERLAQQSTSDTESVRRIQESKKELADLFRRVESVQVRAKQTEQAIAEMTADIKRLDNTKRNLTLSMTALKRLQMLTTAYEQLRALSKSRQYREVAQLLQAVIQLMAHFKSYRSIDQIATLSRNVSDLQAELLEQICEDFEIIFTKGDVAQRRQTLAEGCLVMDALGDHARSRLINWYCNTQLREYRQVFRGNDEAGSLDNIARRYSWFNRMLKTYDHEHANIFPSHWRAGEMLANAFCEGTRDDYKAILQRSMRRADGQSLDVNLLLSCLQETLNFEHGLEKRFVGESRSSMDTMTSTDDKKHVVGQIISEAFEPYMTLWVESQDKYEVQLELMCQTLTNQQAIGWSHTKISLTARVESRRGFLAPSRHSVFDRAVPFLPFGLGPMCEAVNRRTPFRTLKDICQVSRAVRPAGSVLLSHRKVRTKRATARDYYPHSQHCGLLLCNLQPTRGENQSEDRRRYQRRSRPTRSG